MTEFQASGSVTFEIDNLDQVGADLQAEAEESLGSVTIPMGDSGGGRSGRQRRRSRQVAQSIQDQDAELQAQTELLEEIAENLGDGVGGGGGFGGGGGGGDGGGPNLPSIPEAAGGAGILGLLSRFTGLFGLSGASAAGSAAISLPFFGNRMLGPGNSFEDQPGNEVLLNQTGNLLTNENNPFFNFGQEFSSDEQDTPPGLDTTAESGDAGGVSGGQTTQTQSSGIDVPDEPIGPLNPSDIQVAGQEKTTSPTQDTTAPSPESDQSITPSDVMLDLTFQPQFQSIPDLNRKIEKRMKEAERRLKTEISGLQGQNLQTRMR